jgi:hypothetical protein
LRLCGAHQRLPIRAKDRCLRTDADTTQRAGSSTPQGRRSTSRSSKPAARGEVAGEPGSASDKGGLRHNTHWIARHVSERLRHRRASIPRALHVWRHRRWHSARRKLATSPKHGGGKLTANSHRW